MACAAQMSKNGRPRCPVLRDDTWGRTLTGCQGEPGSGPPVGLTRSTVAGGANGWLRPSIDSSGFRKKGAMRKGSNIRKGSPTVTPAATREPEVLGLSNCRSTRSSRLRSLMSCVSVFFIRSHHAAHATVIVEMELDPVPKDRRAGLGQRH